MGKGGITRVLTELRDIDADSRMAGAILGMLAPWIPKLRDTPPATPADVKSLQMALPGLGNLLPGDEWRWPTLEDAIGWLTRNQIVTRSDLRRIQDQLRQQAYTDAMTRDPQTVRAIRDVIVDSIRAGDAGSVFRERIQQLADIKAHEARTLLRTNTKQAFLFGQDKLLDQPRVRDRFRWIYYAATADSRVRPHHWFFNKWVAERRSPLGHLLMQVQGEFNCRCTIIPADQHVVDEYGLKTIDDVPEWVFRAIKLDSYAGDRVNL